jgi:hypothetical protein
LPIDQLGDGENEARDGARERNAADGGAAIPTHAEQFFCNRCPCEACDKLGHALAILGRQQFEDVATVVLPPLWIKFVDLAKYVGET